MRRALLLALCLVLAGCQAPGSALGPGDDTATATTDDGPAEMGPAPPDPDGDPLGWENGYWHNESIDVTAGDGLNESEQDAAVSRAMARIEFVRELEFNRTVPVDVINRTTYQQEQGPNHTEALQRFDNAKFEALFLIGEEENSIETQEETRGATVLGYYSSNRSSIVLVSESEQPTLSGENVLAHELVHALQDQHFGLANLTALTRDAYQGRNGIVEGDANYVQRLYMDRCGEQWACIDGASSGSGATATAEGATSTPSQAGNGSQVHPGIQVLEYFPYSDGPGFVDDIRAAGGWAAVNDVYSNVPEGATEVINPDSYPDWEPANVTLENRSSDQWQRIRPPNRPDYGRMGQSAIVASQAYTLTDDYNGTAVVFPQQVVNFHQNGSVDRSDPYEYDTPAAAGWAGGRFHAFERAGGDGEGDDLAYVWRTQWESDAEAQEFAQGWTDLMQHWDAERVGENVWVIDQGPYADAFRVRTDGNTVTIVNAPTREELSAVHGE